MIRMKTLKSTITVRKVCTPYNVFLMPLRQPWNRQIPFPVLHWSCAIDSLCRLLVLLLIKWITLIRNYINRKVLSLFEMMALQLRRIFRLLQSRYQSTSQGCRSSMTFVASSFPGCGKIGFATVKKSSPYDKSGSIHTPCSDCLAQQNIFKKRSFMPTQSRSIPKLPSLYMLAQDWSILGG